MGNTQFIGKNSALVVFDSGGVSRNISGDLNNIALAWSRDNPEVTTMGKDSKQRLAGLRDATLTGAAIWSSSATTGIDAILAGIMAASLNTLLVFAPGGCLTGCPSYNACMLLNSYSVTAPLGGAVAAAFSFNLASGSISASTCS